MPNHCDQDLLIHGPKKDVDAFLKAVRSDVPKNSDQFYLIDANKIMPIPEGADWYEWCTKHWGTKWGMYRFNKFKRTTRGARVSFLSAWSPAEKLVRKMAKMFPTIKFTLSYYEMGMQYQGKLIVKGKEVLLDEYSEDYKGQRGG